jgi:hypothetical protein
VFVSFVASGQAINSLYARGSNYSQYNGDTGIQTTICSWKERLSHLWSQCQCFKTGTPEEYSKTMIALHQVCVGHNLKDSREKYTMAYRVFQDEALTSFSNAAAKMSNREDKSDVENLH